MKKEDKNIIIESIAEDLGNSKHFYLTDISTLNASATSLLRRKCFEQNIKLVVVKNTLFRKALERSENKFDSLYGVLEDATAVMYTESGSVPAKLIKEFRKGRTRPVLKAAFVEESIYIGDDQLDVLASIKTKEELIGDVLLAIQAPMNNLLSALKSQSTQIAGVLKTLSEREQ
jgi:large subunit ribosomal protein L10